jgi:hypothetical protein
VVEAVLIGYEVVGAAEKSSSSSILKDAAPFVMNTFQRGAWPFYHEAMVGQLQIRALPRDDPCGARL